MNNNDVFKKLRVALMLRDDQIVDILKLVDFRMSKNEINAFFRAEGSDGYVMCKDQVLRNFLNGLVIYLRGTKEDPKDPYEQLARNKKEAEINVEKAKLLASKPAYKPIEKPATTFPKSPVKPKPRINKKRDTNG